MSGDAGRCRRQVERLREIVAEEERAKEQESDTAEFIATVESEMAADDNEKATTDAPEKEAAEAPRGTARSSPERRLDTDGIAYTKAEFVEEYGGTWEWGAARRLRRPPQSGSRRSRDYELGLSADPPPAASEAKATAARETVAAPKPKAAAPSPPPAQGRVAAERQRLKGEEERLRTALIRAKSPRSGVAELSGLADAIDAAVAAGLTGDTVRQARELVAESQQDGPAATAAAAAAPAQGKGEELVDFILANQRAAQKENQRLKRLAAEQETGAGRPAKQPVPEDLSTIDGGLAALLTEAWGQGILSAESLRGVLDDLRSGRFSTEHYVNLYQDRVLQAAQPQLSRRERRRLEVDARLAEVCRARAPTPG
jgi:hypothetical protein